jgi:signal peptidase I
VTRKVVYVLSAAYLGLLFSMAFWALAPAAAGWKPVLIVGGSMMPLIERGDVVVASPVTDPATLVAGQVVVMDRPGFPGTLVTHRVVGRDAQGRLITRGDANSTDDTDPVDPAAIHGLARLRVPGVGLPVFWLREQHWLPVGAWLAGTVLAVVAVSGRPPRAGRRHLARHALSH